MQNEVRLIDANALQLEADQHNVMNGVAFVGQRGGGRTLEMVKVLLNEMIRNAPTLDAVPVVRCGECEHRGNSAFCPLRHLEYTECEGYHYADYTLDDSFCSFGKKKDGGAADA